MSSAVDSKELIGTFERWLADHTDWLAEDEYVRIEGPALSLMDEYVSAAKKILPDHLAVSKMEELISVEGVQRGEPVYVKDLRTILHAVVEALRARTPTGSISSAAKYRLSRPRQ